MESNDISVPEARSCGAGTLIVTDWCPAALFEEVEAIVVAHSKEDDIDIRLMSNSTGPVELPPVSTDKATPPPTAGNMNGPVELPPR